ncbi:hypothetical protein N8467_00380 [bacterium]|nr:hypothetical protein [bacterium]
MAEESDFLALQKITCKPEAQPDVEPEVCPDCVPNPNFIDLNIFIDLDQAYYNEATCEYCYIFNPETQLENDESLKEAEDRIKNEVEKGNLDLGSIKGFSDEGSNPDDVYNKRIFIYYLQELCESFNKTADVAYLVEGSRNDENLVPLEVVTSLEVRADDTGLLYARLCVPKGYFEALPEDDGEEVDDPIPADGETVLRMKADEFIAATYRLQFALKAYNVFYKQALAFDSGYLYKEKDSNKTPLRPDNLPTPNDVKAFRNKVDRIIDNKGYKFGVLRNISPFPSKRIDEIKLVFKGTDDWCNLKKISVKPSGCGFRKIWTNKKNPFKVGFSTDCLIAKLEDIDYDTRSESGPTWHEFYEKYLFPKVKLESSLLNNPLTNKNNPLNCTLNKFGDFKDFLHTLIGSFEDAMAFLSFELNKEGCEKTIKKIEEENKENTPTLTEFQRMQKLMQEPSSISGPVLSKIDNNTKLSEEEKVQLKLQYYRKYGTKDKIQRKEFRDIDPNSFKNMYHKTLDPKRGILEAILVRIGGADVEPTGQEAIKSFKDANPKHPGLDRFIATITFCELNYLFQNVISCLLGGIPFEQAAVIILRSQLKSLSAKHLGKLIFALPLDKQREVRRKVEAAIDTKVEPWSDSWADGGYKDSLTPGGSKKASADDDNGEETEESETNSKYEIALEKWEAIVEAVDATEPGEKPKKKVSKEDVANWIDNSVKDWESKKSQANTRLVKKRADYGNEEDSAKKQELLNQIDEIGDEITRYDNLIYYANKAKDPSHNLYSNYKSTVQEERDAELENWKKAKENYDDWMAKKPKEKDYEDQDDQEPSKAVEEGSTEEEETSKWDQLQTAEESGIIGETTQIILDAYIEAILDSFKFDELLEILDKSPVVKISIDLILGLFGQAYCPSAPLGQLTNKYLKDVTETMTKFKYEPCTNEFLKMPKLPTFPANTLIQELKMRFGDLVRAAIKKAINALILKLVFKAIRIIDDLLCKGLAVLGNNAFNSFLGKQNDLAFVDLFANSICEDLTPNEGLQALEQIMSNMGLTPENLAVVDGDPRLVTRCLSRSIGITVSKREVLNIFLGNDVSPNVYNRISSTVNLNCPDLKNTIGDPDAIKSFFDGIKQFISPDSLDNIEEMLSNIPVDESVCDLICLNNEALNQWDELRRNGLQDSGMNPEDAANSVNYLNNLAEDELENFVNASNNLQDMIADEINSLFNDPPPGCDIPDTHPLKTESSDEALMNNSSFVFEQIEMKYQQELSGRRKSILSMILQDTRANSLRTHQFYASWLGTRWYYKDQEDEDAKDRKILPDDMGFFPETVGDKTRQDLKGTEIVSAGANIKIKTDKFVTNVKNKQYVIKDNFIKIYESETIDRKGFLIDNYETDSFLSKGTEKIIKLIIDSAVNDSGYEFGFKKEQLKDSDFNYLDPSTGAEYDHEESDKILGVSGNPDKVIYLNPAIHGGKYTKPKIFIVKEKQKGWMAIKDALSTNKDYCGNKKDTSLAFTYLKEYTDGLKNKIPFDRRLAQDKDCLTHNPFDLVADPDTLSLLSGIVKATIQIYSMKEVIALFPIMSQIRYTPDDFGNYIGNVISERMKEYIGGELKRGLNPTLNKRIKHHRYWFLFLEQAVETYNREIKLGLREKPAPGSKLAEARQNCSRVRKFFPYADNNDRKLYKKFRREKDTYKIRRVKNYPKEGDNFPFNLKDRGAINEFYCLASIFDKDGNYAFDLEDDELGTDKNIPKMKNTKKLNFVSKIYAISRVEEDCLKILNVLISEQVEEIFKTLSETLQPKIYNLSEYMLSEEFDTFKGSSLNIGLYSQEKSLATGQPVDFGDVEELFYFSNTGLQEDNFIIEKYIRVNEKPDSMGFNFQSEQTNVTTLKKFKDLLTENQQLDKSKNLSDYFGSFTIEDGELIGAAPARFGIRICWTESGGNSDEIEKTPVGFKTTVLDSFEYDMFDEKIETFLSTDTNNKYDIKCLVSNLVKQETFTTLMNDVFGKTAALEHILSFHDVNYLSSIGVEDGWDPKKAKDDDEKEQGGEDVDLNKIEEAKEKMFKRTLRLAMSLFESAYKEDDFEDQKDKNREFDSEIFGWLRNLIPTTNLTDLNLDLWKRRKIVDEIENCDEDLLEILEKNL